VSNSKTGLTKTMKKVLIKMTTILSIRSLI